MWMIDCRNFETVMRHFHLSVHFPNLLKAGLSSSKKIRFISLSESPSKMMKNAFYFILKALFVPKILKCLSWLLGHVEKKAWVER